VQGPSGLVGQVGAGWSWSGLAWTGRGLSGLVGACLDWSGGRGWSGLAWTDRGLSRLVVACLDWSGLVSAGRDWLVLVGAG
jgi:hypothetical protein